MRQQCGRPTSTEADRAEVETDATKRVRTGTIARNAEASSTSWTDVLEEKKALKDASEAKLQEGRDRRNAKKDEVKANGATIWADCVRGDKTFDDCKGPELNAIATYKGYKFKPTGTSADAKPILPKVGEKKAQLRAEFGVELPA